MDSSHERVAVIVGGASGIGWATAQTLAAQGVQITVADLNGDGAAVRAAELGEGHRAAQVDVVDEDSVQRLFDDVGPIDIAVNCAGFSNVGLITDMPVAEFRAVIDVCLNGAFIVAKHAGRHLRAGGSLVQISSLNGRQPAAGMSAYCAAKAGLSMLTQVAALEMGARGVRVNAVAPGFVHTPLTAAAASVPGVVEDYVDNTAIGRPGTPQDIADAVAYLCSPAASWLTGEVLDLNGGAHLKRYPDIMGHVNRLMEQA
ncbi:short-chain dehydrogenase [Mycolicibacterium duvalii]|uniref:Short-chain dehydrogenase n=1 Tax=Mycolicibacterium duvalii TaxID=39688 RepID=A0A7I7JVD4_9MYCO|nr:SDR family NAD(P)-dependent oxidoreductase [Mycolicibacterium duvalii]MCV7368508.1 SDR family oxidoreductase [Mycolicibacterium duvalii]PEG36722.1 short-chain dehydrogenase [Mycolicibacterium duvalii]BBX15201.1 short-chain dehydrogenase [Mycolicibacterium duvalii]